MKAGIKISSIRPPTTLERKTKKQSTNKQKKTETKNGLTAEDSVLLSKSDMIFAVVIPSVVQLFLPLLLWKVAK